MDRHPAAYRILPILFVLLPGCVTSGSSLLPLQGEKAAPPARVEAIWERKVFFTPDPANGGTPSPGLAGRVYLFDQVGLPTHGEGGLTADVYAVVPEKNDGKMVHLERTIYDKENLKRLLKKDAIGLGYTIFLPWGTYRPDIRQIQIRVQYTPTQGAPLYVQSLPLTLSDEGQPTAVRRERTELGQVHLPGTMPPPDASRTPAQTQPPAGTVPGAPNNFQGAPRNPGAGAMAPPQQWTSQAGPQQWMPPTQPPPNQVSGGVIPAGFQQNVPGGAASSGYQPVVVQQPSGAKVIYPGGPPPQQQR